MEKYLTQASVLREWNECHIIRNETVVGALLKIILCDFCYCEYVFIEKTDCMRTTIDE